MDEQFNTLNLSWSTKLFKSEIQSFRKAKLPFIIKLSVS